MNVPTHHNPFPHFSPLKSSQAFSKFLSFFLFFLKLRGETTEREDKKDVNGEALSGRPGCEGLLVTVRLLWTALLKALLRRLTPSKALAVIASTASIPSLWNENVKPAPFLASVTKAVSQLLSNPYLRLPLNIGERETPTYQICRVETEEQTALFTFLLDS